MVSAKSDNDNIVEGLRSGSNDFVRKPYQREELLVSDASLFQGWCHTSSKCEQKKISFHMTTFPTKGVVLLPQCRHRRALRRSCG